MLGVLPDAVGEDLIGAIFLWITNATMSDVSERVGWAIGRLACPQNYRIDLNN